MADADRIPVVTENAEGAGSFVIVCDHASNAVPEAYCAFGLAPAVLDSHIAWDPGALGVARGLSGALDSPLFWPNVSRLVVDCNRAPEAPDLIVDESEGHEVPANRGLSAAERSRRLASVHARYHATIDAFLARRVAAGVITGLIAIHSFTPVYLGQPRPWQVGVVFDEDRRLADELVAGLTADPALTVGLNQPYSPADRVYYTVDRHARRHGLAGVMIEIRNDQIADPAGQERWAERLGNLLDKARPRLLEAGNAVT